MSPPGSFYSGWSSGEDFQPLVVRVLFETALRMNSFTGSFIQTFMLRKWHARRVVVRGWMDGVGGAFPALWLDSTRWRVLGAGPDGRSARGDDRAEGAGGHAHGALSLSLSLSHTHTHTHAWAHCLLSPPSCFKLKDSQLGLHQGNKEEVLSTHCSYTAVIWRNHVPQVTALAKNEHVLKELHFEFFLRFLKVYQTALRVRSKWGSWSEPTPQGIQLNKWVMAAAE